MIWSLLGIEETKDRKVITRAYREKLSSVNPEEKPEEFKALREAYEAALAYADSETVPPEEKTPLDLWVAELEDIYFDLGKRLDPAAWDRLVHRDICCALDTEEDALNAMLTFFMQHFRIPHTIMQLLDDRFSLQSREEELKGRFPSDFVDYVILNGIRLQDGIPQELFVPGRDGRAADRFIELYWQILHSDGSGYEEPIREITSLPEKHPYGEALVCRIGAEKGDASCMEEMEKICESNPEDLHLLVDLMLCCRDLGLTEKAETAAQKVLGRSPGDHTARRILADAAAQKEDYKTAAEIVTELMRDCTWNDGAINELETLRNAWNEKMMAKLKEKLEKDPEDWETLYDYVWCFIQNGRNEEAEEASRRLPEGSPDEFGYRNIRSVLAANAGRWEEAAEHLEKLILHIGTLNRDGSEKERKRIGRLPEIRGRLAYVLYETGRHGEAIAAAERSIRENGPDISTLFTLASMYIREKDSEKLLECAGRILENYPGNPGGCYYRARACFEMNRDGEAFEAVNQAIARDGSSLAYYLLKLRILVRNRLNDEAEDLIGLLERSGIQDDPTVAYCRICMFALADRQDCTAEEYDEVLSGAEKLDRRISSGEFPAMDWTAHFYYTYACLKADRQDFDKDYPEEPILEILERGLGYDPSYYSSLSYKGWLLKKSGRKKEALSIYEELEKVPGHSRTVEQNLGELYFAELEDHAADSLRCYEFLLQDSPEDPDLHYYAGICCLRLEDAENAEKHFLLEQKYSPDDIDGYFRLAYVYLKQGRSEEAAEQGRKAAEMASQRTGGTARFWTPLIDAYLRMNEPEKAISAAEERFRHDPKGRDPLACAFDAWLQFGRFDEAGKILKTRLSAPGKKNAYFPDALAKYLMLTKKHAALQLCITVYGQKMEIGTRESACTLLAAHRRNFVTYMRITKAVFDEKMKSGTATDYDRGCFAWGLFVGGKIEMARREAQAALEEARAKEQRATGMRLMYRARQIRLLAILGREDEARAVAASAEELHPCEHCGYRYCKDLAIYRCCMEYIFGNYRKAMDLAAEGIRIWPDEEDFIELSYLITAKTKGKIKC